MRHRLLLVLLGVALVASGCGFLRPIPGTDGRAVVSVGPPGAGGAVPVSVSVPGLAAGTAARVEVRVDRILSAPVAVASSVPASVPVALGSGEHVVFASVRIGSRFAFGAAHASGALRLNQLQALGTHNSYHVAPAADPWAQVQAWQYTDSPLDVQFQAEAIRQIELDVYVDSAGHRVLHVPDVDFGTTCSTYVVCLRTVKAWSDAHPTHVPIAILTELNDTYYGTPTQVAPWTTAAMDQLDAEIRSVFPASQVITPDDVRGTHATLGEAVTTDGWPTIDSVRGKVLFLMDNGGSYRDRYRAGHPTLEGRVLFTNSSPGEVDAAFVKLNDPKADAAAIHDAVVAGYVVRTRADSDTVEARANDTSRRDAALAGGAQWVSTDFPVAGRAYGTPYSVSIPGGSPARCNPLNAPAWCAPGLVEHL